jgi:hypothetical protein
MGELTRLLKRGAVVVGLMLATLVVFQVPESASAASPCSDCACINQFGYCKDGTGPWEGVTCQYSGCDGGSCYYTCGAVDCVEQGCST